MYFENFGKFWKISTLMEKIQTSKLIFSNMLMKCTRVTILNENFKFSRYDVAFDFYDTFSNWIFENEKSVILSKYVRI